MEKRQKYKIHYKNPTTHSHWHDYSIIPYFYLYDTGQDQSAENPEHKAII